MSRTAHPAGVRTFPGNAYMDRQHSHYKAVRIKPVWALRGFLAVVKGEAVEKRSSINAICAMLLVLNPEEATLVMVRH